MAANGFEHVMINIPPWNISGWVKAKLVELLV
jgi:hypothetical protein